MIHILTPYRIDKDLGKAYNDACRLIPDEDWICLRDIDCMFLTPDAPAIMQKYVENWPETGVFTCFTNRISQLSKEQLLNGRINDNSDILWHINRAEAQAQNKLFTPILRGEISGYLMLFSKKTWLLNPFDEGIGCIGVDTYWSRRLKQHNLDIKRMDAIYVWHTYRLKQGISNREHLYVDNS